MCKVQLQWVGHTPAVGVAEPGTPDDLDLLHSLTPREKRRGVSTEMQNRAFIDPASFRDRSRLHCGSEQDETQVARSVAPELTV